MSSSSDDESDDERVERGSDGSGGDTEGYVPKLCDSPADLTTAAASATRWLQLVDDNESDDGTIDLTAEGEEAKDEAAGPGGGEKFRHFFGTIHLNHILQWQRQPHHALAELCGKSEWAVVGCEKASRKHLQVAFSFKNPRTCTSVFKVLGGAIHLEPMRGSPAGARAYCLKEKHIRSFEWGKVPAGVEGRKAGSKKGGAATAAVYKAVFELAENGEYGKIRDEHPGIFLAHGKNLPVLTQLALGGAEDLPKGSEIQAYFAYGVPGSGKSEWIRAKARSLGYEKKDIYVKTPEERWWQNYTNQPCVVMDDLAPDQIKTQAWQIKKWGERFAFPMNQKGAGHTIRPKAILITSNYSLDILFNQLSPVEFAAVKRRYKQYYFEDKEYMKWTILDPEGLAKKPLEGDGPSYGSNSAPAMRIIQDGPRLPPIALQAVAPTMNMPPPRSPAGSSSAASSVASPVQLRRDTPMPGAPVKRKQKKARLYPGTAPVKKQ